MKRLLKYGILSALIFFPGFSGATFITKHYESTGGAYTWDGAVSSCQSKGVTWDLATAGADWAGIVNSGLTGYVKDTASNISSVKCGYDTTWPEDWKGVVMDAVSDCVGDIPKSNNFPGICYGSKCNYATGYGVWGACNPSTGMQIAIGNPFLNSVYGLTCTDVSPIRRCGVCNATTVATATSVSPTNLCTFGTPTIPMRSGANWIWSCNTNGINASCSAPYVTAPNVTLSASPAELRNLNNDSKDIGLKPTTLTWTITNPGVCGTGCTCDLTGPTGTIPNKFYLTERSYTTNLSRGSHNFSVICKNSYGIESNRATTTVIGTCNPYDYSEPCNEKCGEAYKENRRIEADCDDVSLDKSSCDLPDCPLPTEVREVKP